MVSVLIESDDVVAAGQDYAACVVGGRLREHGARR
jgi:hypothetical protein